MTNSNLLKGKMVAHGLRQSDLATLLNLSSTALNNKINNRTDFRDKEIAILINVLALNDSEIRQIFFAPAVE